MQTRTEKTRNESAPGAAGLRARIPTPRPAPAGPDGAPAARPAVLDIRTAEANGLTWVDIQRPGRAEIEWLRQHYPGFHPLHLDDIISRIQRPKLDERDDYLFLVLHLPVYNKITRLTTASEVDIFAGPGFLITVHSGHLRPLLRLFDQTRDEPRCGRRVLRRGSGYLLYMHHR